MLTRRVMGTGAVVAAAAAWSSLRGTPAARADQTAAAAGPFDVTYTEAEWRKRLTPDQFAVLRQSGTERPFSSPLNDGKRRE